MNVFLCCDLIQMETIHLQLSKSMGDQTRPQGKVREHFASEALEAKKRELDRERERERSVSAGEQCKVMRAGNNFFPSTITGRLAQQPLISDMKSLLL